MQYPMIYLFLGKTREWWGGHFPREDDPHLWEVYELRRRIADALTPTEFEELTLP